MWHDWKEITQNTLLWDEIAAAKRFSSSLFSDECLENGAEKENGLQIAIRYNLSAIPSIQSQLN